jgi:CRISPR/Cas system-associated protein Cas7 (RAMP superfamily)
MVKTIEESKKEFMEKMSAAAGSYFEELAQELAKPSSDINDIETVMIKGKQAFEGVLRERTSAALKQAEREEKNVPSAEGRCSRSAKNGQS